MAEKKSEPGIKNDLKAGIFKNVYLFYGEENFLKDFYKNEIIKNTIEDSAFDFNYKEFNSKKPDYDEAEDFLNSYPFMADKKILYIKNSGIFKKAREEDKEFWGKIFKDVPPYAVIIFSESVVDKRNSIFKEISKNFHAEEFPLQEKNNLISWASRYIGQYQKKMNADVIRYFLDSCTNDMYNLKNELEKLASYKKDSSEITISDIDKCCCKMPESTVWEMISDILNGKSSSAARKFSELKMQNEEPIRINAAIYSKFSSYRKIKILSQSYSVTEIAAKMKQREFFVRSDLNQIKDYKIEYFTKIMNLCENTDRRIKQGYSDAWTELEITFANMTEK